MIIGHQKIRDRLARSNAKNTSLQTYLFVGPESVGKFEVALEFAHTVIHESSQELSADYHTDIDMLVIEPLQEVEKGVVKEKDISAEQAREAMKFLGSSPYAGKKKVLIIRDAHRLTETAQNALLKTLEEPPAYAVIILVTHEIGRILPTILSRCQQIAFRLVGVQEMMEGVLQYPLLATLPVQNRFLLEMGRPGLVIRSMQEGAEFEERLQKLDYLMRLSEKSLRDRLAFSESCSTHVRETIQLLMWWSGGLHLRMVADLSDANTPLLYSLETIERLRYDLKKFPSSARLLLDTFFLHW